MKPGLVHSEAALAYPESLRNAAIGLSATQAWFLPMTWILAFTPSVILFTCRIVFDLEILSYLSWIMICWIPLVAYLMRRKALVTRKQQILEMLQRR
jgi:hypothetical protein